MIAVQCNEVLELIEAIAAGDRPLDEPIRLHVETCPRCASALASAQRIESVLRAVEVPAVPETFTPAVLQRIRRDRWRSEQQVDRLFNLAMVAGVIVVLAAIAAMMNVDTVLAVIESSWALARDNTREAVKAYAPTFATYVAAAGLLASAVVMWSWAERRLGF
jgi:hypothetical protein